jgi:O-methyltransferase
MFSPQQLFLLSECIREAAGVDGCCVEAGCAFGATTVFLKKFMEGEHIDKDYVAIDTFQGFVEEHSAYEISNRSKDKEIFSAFSENKKTWYDYSLRLGGIDKVRSIEVDVTKFDFSTIAPIAFCLVDVDLFLAIADVLPKIYASLSRGGIIVVDDCKKDTDWDGALEAYLQFMSKLGLPAEIRCEKLGLIRKL